MLDANVSPAPRGVAALKSKLAFIRARQPDLQPEMIAEVVRAVMTTMSDDLTAKETSLLQEIEDLARTIATAKSEIAALQMDDINGYDIPFATDELDAIVGHTAQATHAILEVCETLDEVAATVGPDQSAKLQDATTRIYEACSFQDITGQRITKIITTLKTIEGKVAHIITTFGPGLTHAIRATSDHVATDADLLNGPQLPDQAMGQSEIDKLMASFE